MTEEIAPEINPNVATIFFIGFLLSLKCEFAHETYGLGAGVVVTLSGDFSLNVRNHALG
jgi:hypothetical protein